MVSEVGQCDNRVTTIVAWDNLRTRVANCDGRHHPGGRPQPDPVARHRTWA